jgi:hypothetical protein
MTQKSSSRLRLRHCERSEFTTPGGTIYGANASASLKNTATNGDGHAVYVQGVYKGGDRKKRDSTVGESDNLDSSVDGAAGGWE